MITKLITAMFIMLIASLSESNAAETLSNTLSPFTTDGCSIVPDGTFTNKTKWQKCCISHDIQYWAGGTKQERKEADKALGQCISDIQNEVIGTLYNVGVRILGGPNQDTSYRWGYGWKYNRGYKPLTEYEKSQIAENVPSEPDVVAVTKPINNLEPYPTSSGNYCVDEISRALVKANPNAAELIVLSMDNKNDIIFFTTDGSQSVMRAKFSALNLKFCTEKHFSDLPTQYLQFISGVKSENK